MVTKYNTEVNSGSGKGSGVSSKLIWAGVILIGAYLGYKYILKPRLDKRNEKDRS